MKKFTSVILTIILLGTLVVFFAVSMNLLFELGLVENLILGWTLTILYIIFVLILTRRKVYFYTHTKIKKEVEKPTPIKEPKERLVIPKYNYVASTQTKTYHKKNCRLGKLIKKKFRVTNNSESFFKTRNYKPCKSCIKAKK